MPKKRRTLEEIQKLVSSGDEHAFYVSREWKDIRKKVLQRDNYECQRCKGKFIVEQYPVKRIKITSAKYVHHINSMKEHFNSALELDNLVSLCFECHEIVEGKIDRLRKPTKEKLTKEMW